MSTTQTADLIYLNGKVYTVNADQKWAEAFAIIGDKFVKVGTNEEIQALRGEKTEVVDLRGHLVLPGLNDDHMHPDMAAENYFNVDIDAEASTYEDFKTAVHNFLEANPDAPWVFGGNLDYLWDDGSDIKMFGKPSHKSIIDELVSDRPAYIWEVSGHAALLNSKALEVCGITKDTPDPEGGHYVKDENGELTGVVREMASQQIWEEYLKGHLPARDIAYRWMKPVFGYLNSLGLTSISDVWAREWFLKSYNILDNDDALTLRITAYVTDPVDFNTKYMKELAMLPINDPKAYSTERVSVIGVKFVLDGAAAGRTALLLDPYEGEDEYCGPWRTDPEIFEKKFMEYDKRGLTVKAHAGGDGAIRLTLDMIERSRKEHGSTLRHSVAHTALLSPDDIHRFEELGAIAEFSPVFWFDMPAVKVLREDIGEKRINQMYPIRATIDSGAHVSIGTDWVVTPVNPWRAMETVVTRRSPGVTSGPALNSAHAITLEEAVYLYTMGSAYAQYRENEKGSIEPGKYADFIVVKQNIFEIPIHEVHKTEVLSTVVGGKDVYIHDSVQKIIDLGEISGEYGGYPCSDH